MDSLYDSSRRSRIPKWLVVLGLCGAAIAYFWAYSDHVTTTALAVVTLAGFAGYRIGAARLLGFLGGIVFASAVAPVLGTQLEPRFQDWLGTTGAGNRALSIGVTGLGIFLVVVLTTRLLTLWILREQPFLRACNRWIGVSLGVFQGGAVILFIVGGLLAVEPMAKNQVYTAGPTRGKISQIVSKRVLRYAGSVRESSIGPWVVQYNPFRRIPQLEQLLGSVGSVSRSQATQGPGSSGASAVDSGLLSTIEALRNNPQFRELLESSPSIDGNSALSILKNLED